MNYRIAYLGETMVNWCPGLGTVLANDEVVNGVSERGGYPVVQKLMKQWCLRVSAYSQRLLDGLETVNWSDSIKETQKNWIGRSEGTEVEFKYLTPLVRVRKRVSSLSLQRVLIRCLVLASWYWHQSQNSLQNSLQRLRRLR